jgi:hypothetical protein
MVPQLFADWGGRDPGVLHSRKCQASRAKTDEALQRIEIGSRVAPTLFKLSDGPEPGFQAPRELCLGETCILPRRAYSPAESAPLRMAVLIASSCSSTQTRTSPRSNLRRILVGATPDPRAALAGAGRLG